MSGLEANTIKFIKIDIFKSQQNFVLKSVTNKKKMNSL